MPVNNNNNTQSSESEISSLSPETFQMLSRISFTVNLLITRERENENTQKDSCRTSLILITPRQEDIDAI